MMVSSCAVLFFPRDEILDLIESVSEGSHTYFGICEIIIKSR